MASRGAGRVALPPMLIRTEHPSDHAAVGALHRAAFGGEHGGTAARPVTPSAALSLVAEEDGEVAGHVMFSRCLLDAPRRQVAVQSLSPLAVAPHLQRRGIGSALIQAGPRRLDERGVPLVFLEGDPGYYARAGFTPAGDHGFRKPSLRIPDQGFQVIRLSAYEPWMTGALVYSAPFWDHDCVGRREPLASTDGCPPAGQITPRDNGRPGTLRHTAAHRGTPVTPPAIPVLTLKGAGFLRFAAPTHRSEGHRLCQHPCVQAGPAGSGTPSASARPTGCSVRSSSGWTSTRR
ncbi:hypothetical protein GCM10009827_059050 [Dactylosporangium maewongense]|uniref:N-acetyltransferase domain-containing protein n=1 Tax=Dactylosporangium maewongense TaxID=634393 RepID=A0ABN2B3M1_9ACTN